MSCKEHDELAPGEMHACSYAINGERPYVRRTEDGELETGVLVRAGHAGSRAAAGIIERENVRPGVDRVTRIINYTARGPVRVNSDAFRSGWDDVFGGAARAPKSRSAAN